MSFFYVNHTWWDKSKYLLCRTLYSTLVLVQYSQLLDIKISIVFSMVLFSMVSKILCLLFNLIYDAWDIQEVAIKSGEGEGGDRGGGGGGVPPISLESS